MGTPNHRGERRHSVVITRSKTFGFCVAGDGVTLGKKWGVTLVMRLFCRNLSTKLIYNYDKSWEMHTCLHGVDVVPTTDVPTKISRVLARKWPNGGDSSLTVS